MENVENSLWQKRKQFKNNWSISLDSGCERTPFTRLECLVASAQCLLGVFIYVGTSIHSRFFNFHPTESDSICFMSKICGFVALHRLLFPLSQIKYLLFTPFFYEPLPSFNSFACFCLNGSLSIRKRWWMYNNVIKVPLPFDHCFTL